MTNSNVCRSFSFFHKRAEFSILQLYVDLSGIIFSSYQVLFYSFSNEVLHGSDVNSVIFIIPHSIWILIATAKLRTSSFLSVSDDSKILKFSTWVEMKLLLSYRNVISWFWILGRIQKNYESHWQSSFESVRQGTIRFSKLVTYAEKLFSHSSKELN